MQITPHPQELFHAKMKVNTFTVCEICVSTEQEEDGANEVLILLSMPL